MRNIIGKRVKEGRKKLNLSQEELAAKLESSGWKINRVGIAKIETGLRQVTDIQVMILAKILKVPSDWLLDQDSFDNLFTDDKGFEPK